MELNEYQKAAVYDESNACIVKANVGSGKTTVLIQKIIYLHEKKQIPYKDMMVLTFTNKAANEIKERLLNMDKNVQAEELLLFGTFHSVALNLLKHFLNVEQLGYTKEFSVIDPDEELDLADYLIHKHELKIKYRNRLKKRLEQTKPSDSDDLDKLKVLLQEEKKVENKMTFHDLLTNAVTLMDRELICPKWIIVDEVQDCDELQLAFIEKAKAETTCLFAVGDPNQVIYSWRGSDSLVFYSLLRKYNATELTLPINYRSSESILKVAECFKEQGVKLSGMQEKGELITVKNHYNPFQEAQYLVTRIGQLVSEGVQYKDIAIFYRLQTQSKLLEDTFKKHGIPFEVSVKKTLKDYPVINWSIKLLRAATNLKDSASLLDVMTDRAYGEKLTVKKALSVLKEQAFEKSLLFKKSVKFQDNCSNITDADMLYDYFSLDSYLHPTSATYQSDRELVMDLFQTIVAYAEKEKMSLYEGMKQFLNSSALYGVNAVKKDIDETSNSVKLMTLHAAKGLEFDSVFLIGINNGLIPLRTRSMEEAEEERRLFFVGITRAKRRLEFSYYTNPDQRGVISGESRFLKSIPPELLKRDDRGNETVNLIELRRQVQALKEEKARSERDDTKEEVVIEEAAVKVRHPKYGIGTVIKEDDMMITVAFENYGEKEFMKAFSGLEALS